MRELAQLSKYLIGKGFKSTRQRELIASTFFSTGGHISAEDLYRKITEQESSIGLATVYRTLKLLSEAGLAREHRFGDNSSTYEPLTPKKHHDHMVCTGCRSVVEFENIGIERLQEKVAARYGFKIESHKLELYGLCQKCRS